jgi:hypothetical protein
LAGIQMCAGTRVRMILLGTCDRMLPTVKAVWK